MGKGTRKAIRKALQHLPSTLEETYQQILQNIDKDHQEEAKCILQWITYSYEPLTLKMAQEILAIEVDGQEFVPENRTPSLEHHLHKIIDSTLVIITEIGPFWNRSNQVQLAHPSVKEFLISARMASTSLRYLMMNENLVHDFIAQSCIIYLLHCAKENEIQLENFPLFGYGSRYWTEHTRNLNDSSDSMQCLIPKFLNSNSTAYYNWALFKNPDSLSLEKYD